MSKKNPLPIQDFVRLALESNKAKVKRVSGSHYMIEFNDGTIIPVPIHGNKQLGKGLLHKIKKAFQADGVI